MTTLTRFSTEELLSALAHEAANHLTAARMHAELFTMGRDPVASGRAVMHAAGRAGALNACISPLSQPTPEPTSINALELVDQVHERIVTGFDAKFPLSVLSCHVMRGARGDLEECVRALTLLAIELYCLDSQGPKVLLGTNAGLDRMEIHLTVESQQAPGIHPERPGTGAGLALHIAEAVARRHGGWVSLRTTANVQTAALWLPAKPD